MENVWKKAKKELVQVQRKNVFNVVREQKAADPAD